MKAGKIVFRAILIVIIGVTVGMAVYTWNAKRVFHNEAGAFLHTQFVKNSLGVHFYDFLSLNVAWVFHFYCHIGGIQGHGRS